MSVPLAPGGGAPPQLTVADAIKRIYAMERAGQQVPPSDPAYQAIAAAAARGDTQALTYKVLIDGRPTPVEPGIIGAGSDPTGGIAGSAERSGSPFEQLLWKLQRQNASGGAGSSITSQELAQIAQQAGGSAGLRTAASTPLGQRAKPGSTEFNAVRERAMSGYGGALTPMSSNPNATGAGGTAAGAVGGDNSVPASGANGAADPSTALEGPPAGSFMAKLGIKGAALDQFNEFSGEGQDLITRGILKANGGLENSSWGHYLQDDQQVAGIMARILAGNLTDDATPHTTTLAGYENFIKGISGIGQSGNNTYVNPGAVEQMGLKQAFESDLPVEEQAQLIMQVLGSTMPYYDAMSQRLRSGNLTRMQQDWRLENAKNPTLSFEDYYRKNGGL